MYTAYFGFREKPFSVTPDPRFFYVNPVYQEAYATLLYGVRERKGFIVLTGEVGTGKTTLLRRLMNALEPSFRFAFFYHTTLTFDDLMSFACQEFGLSGVGDSRLQKIHALNEFLIAQLAKGGTAALLIDEAQHLGEDILENLRLLSNLETAREKLLQIVLVGQPELQTKLDQPGLRQINQRVAVRYHISRLKDQEVGPFIHHRLRMAGCERRDLFTPDAIQRIALYSRGVPRLINIICDTALLTAYGASRKTVSGTIIDEVAHDLRLTPEHAPAITRSSGATTESQIAEPQAPVQPTKPGPTHGRQRRSPHQKPRRPAVAVVALLILVFAGAVASVANHFRGQETVTRLTLALEGLLARVGEPLRRLVPSSNATAPERQPDNAAPGTEPAAPVEPERQEQRPFLYAATEGHGGAVSSRPGKPVPADVSAPKDRHPIVMGYGTTVSETAFAVYGEFSSLVLDLIKEFNPHIEDLNRILAGQPLWFPPLTRETLLRRQPDGSHRLILASFRSSREAEQFAQLVRQKGYEIAIIPRRVTDTVLLHRIEIGALHNLEEADRAWKIAVANRWLSVAGSALRKGS